jgi:hypothetical protein
MWNICKLGVLQGKIKWDVEFTASVLTRGDRYTSTVDEFQTRIYSSNLEVTEEKGVDTP